MTCLLTTVGCDGAMYHSAVSVRERDVFRQRFLEALGWTIVRIWSPSWRDNRHREMQKIVNVINKMLAADKSKEELSGA